MTTEKWDSSLYDDRHSFVWKKGAPLVGMLAPQPDERILDLGCGSGHLTALIAESGARVTGLDSSPAMIAQARQNFPKLKFHLGDARDFHFDEPFDAVFSNAALHWVKEPASAASCIAKALRTGGRLVLEMGTRDNTQRVMNAVEGVLREAGYAARHDWYFPSLGEYSLVLEQAGLLIDEARAFERWTQLEHPERGMREWLEMFAGAYFNDVPDAARGALLLSIEQRLRPELFRDGAWFVDYRRLRIAASLPERTQSGIPIPR